MQVNFSVDQLIDEVKRLAQENPDFVYQKFPGKVRPIAGNCYYTKSANDLNKGCIFGQAILNLQPDLKDFLLEVDNRTDSNGIGQVLKDLGFPRLTWCIDVQSNQDHGYCWKKAVELAGNE